MGSPVKTPCIVCNPAGVQINRIWLATIAQTVINNGIYRSRFASLRFHFIAGEIIRIRTLATYQGVTAGTTMQMIIACNGLVAGIISDKGIITGFSMQHIIAGLTNNHVVARTTVQEVRCPALGYQRFILIVFDFILYIASIKNCVGILFIIYCP